MRKNTLKEIWDGDKLFQHRVENLKGNRKNNDMCSECGQLTHCLPDNIDPYKEELLDRLVRSRDAKN